jgi:hypothetical protein
LPTATAWEMVRESAIFYKEPEHHEGFQMWQFWAQALLPSLHAALLPLQTLLYLR